MFFPDNYFDRRQTRPYVDFLVAFTICTLLSIDRLVAFAECSASLSGLRFTDNFSMAYCYLLPFIDMLRVFYIHYDDFNRTPLELLVYDRTLRTVFDIDRPLIR